MDRLHASPSRPCAPAACEAQSPRSDIYHAPCVWSCSSAVLRGGRFKAESVTTARWANMQETAPPRCSSAGPPWPLAAGMELGATTMLCLAALSCPDRQQGARFDRVFWVARGSKASSTLMHVSYPSNLKIVGLQSKDCRVSTVACLVVCELPYCQSPRLVPRRQCASIDLFVCYLAAWLYGSSAAFSGTSGSCYVRIRPTRHNPSGRWRLSSP